MSFRAKRGIRFSSVGRNSRSFASLRMTCLLSVWSSPTLGVNQIAFRAKPNVIPSEARNLLFQRRAKQQILHFVQDDITTVQDDIANVQEDIKPAQADKTTGFYLSNQSSARSCQVGLTDSINSTFLFRRQPFNCFSRVMALSADVVSS